MPHAGEGRASEGESEAAADELGRAFEDAYSQVARGLVGWVIVRVQRWRLPATHSADDIVQESVIRMLARCRQHRSVPDAFPSLLFGIASHVLLEVSRKDMRQVMWPTRSGQALDVPDSVTRASQRLLKKELQQKFRDVIDGLTDDEAEHVALALEGLDQKQIAERMEISHSAARKRWQRLRAVLRGFFDELGYEPGDLGDSSDA